MRRLKKNHLILECPKNELERSSIKTQIHTKYGNNETSQLLYTNGIMDSKIYNELIGFINKIMKTLRE